MARTISALLASLVMLFGIVIIGAWTMPAESRTRAYWVPCTSDVPDAAAQAVKRCVHKERGASFKYGYNGDVVSITVKRARVLLATADF